MFFYVVFFFIFVIGFWLFMFMFAPYELLVLIGIEEEVQQLKIVYFFEIG